MASASRYFRVNGKIARVVSVTRTETTFRLEDGSETTLKNFAPTHSVEDVDYVTGWTTFNRPKR